MSNETLQNYLRRHLWVLTNLLPSKKHQKQQDKLHYLNNSKYSKEAAWGWIWNHDLGGYKVWLEALDSVPVYKTAQSTITTIYTL